MAEIDSNNIIIDNDDVDNRIEELENREGYDVIRLRNDEVLADFDNSEDARQYIEDEDYNPEKVIVRQRELDSDDAEELSNLRELRDAVGVSEYTLYNESYFDDDWVREQARDALGLSYRTDKLDEWPLNLLDWDAAAESQRDALYGYSYRFDGVTFYGDE